MVEARVVEAQATEDVVVARLLADAVRVSADAVKVAADAVKAARAAGDVVKTPHAVRPVAADAVEDEEPRVRGRHEEAVAIVAGAAPAVDPAEAPRRTVPRFYL